MEYKYLEENLRTKIPLLCKNGKFRLIVFSDLHGIGNYDRRVFRDMAAILDKYQPQLVLINGDTVWGDAAFSAETLRPFLKCINDVCAARNIPWAHVFGNHDREKGFLNKDQQSVYEEFSHNIAKRGPEEVDGTGNYVLPVMSGDGQQVIFSVWGLDSGSDIDKFLVQYGYDSDRRQLCYQDPITAHSGYDLIRFTQMMWYWQSSCELENYAGRKIPGMMFFHECIPEYNALFRNPAWTKYRGNMRETVGCGPVNSGLLAEIIERGDVKLIVCGHDHINDFEGNILDVKLSMDAGLNYDGYCDDDLRGGRVVDIDENDPRNYKTYMVRSADCVKDYPGVPDRVGGNTNE